MKSAFATLLLILAACFSAGASAGQFRTHRYDQAAVGINGDDIADIVTDTFTAHFPASKYAIFIDAEAGALSGAGEPPNPYCYAIVGVVKRDGGDPFPMVRFTQTQHFPSNSMKVYVEKPKAIALSCIRKAVKALMRTPFSEAYRADAPVMRSASKRGH